MPAPTVAEVLKSAGLDDAAIAAIDAKAVTAFTTVLSAAESERQAAELAQRAATDLYEKQITPALNSWGNNEANLTAERDYYKTLAEKAKTGGFIAEVPPFKPGETQPGGRDPGGRFVAGGNQVPGSPNLQEFENRAATAIGNLADLQWKHRTLFGKEMPDSPTALAAEAASQRMSMQDWAAKKYDFAGKEKAVREADQKAHDDAIRKEERESVEKRFAEAGGANPDVRQAQISRFAEVRKGVSEGKYTDPLKITPSNREARRAATASVIRDEIERTRMVQ